MSDSRLPKIIMRYNMELGYRVVNWFGEFQEIPEDANYVQSRSNMQYIDLSLIPNYLKGISSHLGMNCDIKKNSTLLL